MIVELRNSKNKAEYDKAVSAGKSALASKDHTKALNFFEIALKTPGYENDDTTIKLRDEANLKAILDGEIQRKKSEESWAESKKKISAFLSDLKNTSLNVASRIESVDSAIALFQKIADSSDAAYLSDSSKEEIATLKSLFISLKSTIVMYPPGFDMVKGSAADTKYWASEIRHKGTGIEMVYVVPGEFMMGSTVQEQDEAVRQGAKRAWVEGEVQHRVKLTKGYYIGKYEVTQGQYENVMGSNPSDFKSSGKEAPVETVNWGDCQAFCKKLGSGFRLPTEAEWEHAARGGNRSKGYIYSGSNNLDEVAWYDKNSGNKTQSVGQKKPNELGIFDMSGNVCEWCSDWYGDYSSGGVTDPAGASTGSTRVLRGGVWFGNVGYCRTADRRMYEPGNRNNLFGFRVVFPVR